MSAVGQARLTDAEARRLAEVADLLIPAGAGLPSASEAGVHEAGAERVLARRPELAPVVRQILPDLAGAVDAADVRQRSGAGFTALCELVAGAYFTTPEVLATIGYPGRPGHDLPDLETLQDELDELVAPLVARGPLWRKA
jgi:hypothetical protein